MKSVNILHITDLHLSDMSKNSSEYLRDDFADRYISEMCQKIKEKNIKIDCVVITGDFVDKGKFENFEHAKYIIKNLYIKLDINESKICVCIGNHDIYCQTDTSGNIINENKEPYKIFSREYVGGYSDKFFSIGIVGEKILFVSIDSNYNRNFKNVPGVLSSTEINEIIIELKNKISTDIELIIIGTHYPCVHFYDYPFPIEQGWHDSHFWSSGESLRHRINKDIKNINILWLFGDTHQPAQMKVENNLYIMSGRFGTSTSNINQSNIARHAQIISYYQHQEVEISFLSFIAKQHNDDPQDGIWKFLDPEKYKIPIFQPELIGRNDNSGHEFEQTIIENIISNKLYTFGRFVINSDEVSLGWISINQLLNQRDILTTVINETKNWITEKRIFSDKLLIIGIDIWGSIIASNISVMLGCKNFVFASRGNSLHHTNHVLLNDEKCSEIVANHDSILLISDVVSSGRTIEKVYTQLNVHCKGSALKMSAIAVISDINQEKKVDLKFLDSFGTFCGNLRIPIHKDIDLPPASVIPRTHNFM